MAMGGNLKQPTHLASCHCVFYSIPRRLVSLELVFELLSHRTPSERCVEPSTGHTPGQCELVSCVSSVLSTSGCVERT